MGPKTAYFRVVLWYKREYLQNETSYRQRENGQINYEVSFYINSKNFDKLYPTNGWDIEPVSGPVRAGRPFTLQLPALVEKKY